MLWKVNKDVLEEKYVNVIRKGKALEPETVLFLRLEDECEPNERD